MSYLLMLITYQLIAQVYDWEMLVRAKQSFLILVELP